MVNDEYELLKDMDEFFVEADNKIDMIQQKKKEARKGDSE